MYKIIGADQKEYGPVTADELRRWISEGRANGQTLVQEEGGPWTPLSSCSEFGLSAAPSAPPPLPSAPAVSTPPPPSAMAGSKTSGMAIAALIMGIVSVTLGLCCCYGLPFNLLGIVFSAVALVQIKNDPEHRQGRGLAIAGLVLSVLSILLAGVLLAVGMAFGWQDILRELKH
jgi:hypothetical protein